MKDICSPSTHKCGRTAVPDGCNKKLVSGSRCYGDEMPPSSLSTHPQGQRQGPKCFLSRCKCPGAFLGAVELTVLCSSSALGALGFPSRSTLTFSQGICSHRPPLQFPVGRSGILWDRPVFSGIGISPPAGRGYRDAPICLLLSSELLEQNGRAKG